MLNDNCLEKLIDFSNSKDCFSSVDIAGGLFYFLWNRKYKGQCVVTNIVGDSRTQSMRRLDEFEGMFIRSNDAVSVIHKVLDKAQHFVEDYAYPIDAFGFPSKARGKKIHLLNQ